MADQSSEPILTDRARRVLERAREVQQELGHHMVTPEHILVGLLHDRRGMSAFVLRELGVSELELSDRTRAALEQEAPAGGAGEDAVVAAAKRWAGELKQVSVGTEHLLLALLDGKSRAAEWLEEAGAGLGAVRSATERLFATVRRRSGAVEPPMVDSTEG